MNELIQTKVTFNLYKVYLQSINTPFNFYNKLKHILEHHNFYIQITNGTIIYDFLLFWYNNYRAQAYLIKLFLKIKYNIQLYDMTTPRYNPLWALRRNFFLKNILYKYSLPKTEIPVCLKNYIIVRQLLDDYIDRKQDSVQKIITLANQSRSK